MLCWIGLLCGEGLRGRTTRRRSAQIEGNLDRTRHDRRRTPPHWIGISHEGLLPSRRFATDPREICFVQPLITRASTDIEVSVQVTGSGLQQVQLVLAW